MKKDFLLMSIESACKNRTLVLQDLAKYGVDEKHRPQLEENLEYFLLRYKELTGNNFVLTS